MNFFKKVLCIIFLTAILCFSCGCNLIYAFEAIDNVINATEPTTEPLENIEDLINTDNIDNANNYVRKQIDYGYKYLVTKEQQDCYNTLLTSVYNVGITADEDNYYKVDEIKLSSDFSTKDMRLVLTAFMEDHPEIFWLSTAFNYAKAEEYMLFRPLSIFSGTDLKELINEFNAKVEEIISEVPKNLSEFERELYLHDYLIDNIAYDEDAAESEKDDYAFNSYGALVKGLATCEGYAESFTLLLSYVGIECANVTGTSDGGNHLWSSVNINNDWYYVDVTFNDTDEEFFSRYQFFNITSERLLTTHKPNGLFEDYSDKQIEGSATKAAVNFNLFIPECTKMEENYYYRNLVHATDFSELNKEEISDALYEAITEKENYFGIYFDNTESNLEYDEYYDLLFKNEQYFFEIAYLLDESIENTNGFIYDEISTYLVWDGQVIFVMLNYEE